MPVLQGRPIVCPRCTSSRVTPFLPRPENAVEFRCRDCGGRWMVRVLSPIYRRVPRKGYSTVTDDDT